ncbi:adenylate kinase [Roseibium sediminicola]|uniref:Adenylate kinase n=1 Tax=Roseibium sediminicola TaxID=2933272 RepID=A0ABT0GWR5_9HYPH|nr:adenylate kinase [Roseibium sp. CAU 1639]MCK7613497.1 adenylate kinase [Roseibium sp. CAU 1639]
MQKPDAAQTMKRVLIAGSPGSGKSRAARTLGDLTGLPVIHLDSHYWQPGWQRPSKETWRATIQELIARPRWIMDGNYASTLDLRLQAADTLIYLDFTTLTCAARVAKRTFLGHGKSRDGELPEGCLERVDWPFFRFVLNYRDTHRDRDLQSIHAFSGRRYIFTRPRQLTRFFAQLKKSIST